MVSPEPPVVFADLTPAHGFAAAPLDADLSAPTSALERVSDAWGEWAVFAPEDAFAHPELQILLAAAAAERPDADLLYGDDVALGDPRGRLWLKPDVNPALLHARDYTGCPVAVRGSALHRLGGLRPEMGTAALYDLVLRAYAASLRLAAVRHVLICHPGARPEPAQNERVAALADHLAAFDPGLAIMDGPTPSTSHVRRRLAAPPRVTILTPTNQARRRDGRLHVEALLDSLERSSWPLDRLHIRIADDQPDGAYAEVVRPFTVERVHSPREPGERFNYGAKMNALWRTATDEHLVIVNDDVEVLSPDWLQSLMTFAVDEDVGGVGARLIYPDGAIQHAGMVGGIFGMFVHPWVGQDPAAGSYCDWAALQRDWSAVTGAVFATRRSVLELVNGFDERFAIEYNDVDLCLRIGALGLRIVQASDAELLHHEKSSRGAHLPPGSETAVFLRRWGQWIADDPAYNPGLGRDSLVVHPTPVWRTWWSALPSRLTTPYGSA